MLSYKCICEGGKKNLVFVDSWKTLTHTKTNTADKDVKAVNIPFYQQDPVSSQNIFFTQIYIVCQKKCEWLSEVNFQCIFMSFQMSSHFEIHHTNI